MNNVIPLKQVDHQTIKDLAHAAADRGDCVHTANVFADGSENRALFDKYFHERDMVLSEFVAA